MRHHLGMAARFVGVAGMTEVPSVAVVVDVMRAFTVTAWAFAQGAEKIDLAGRTVVQKTTNGTVGVHAAEGASLLLCASFVVAEATAQLLQVRGGDDVTFVVTGDHGRADEDLACAQYIAHRAVGAETGATEFLGRAAESRAAADLADPDRPVGGGGR